MPNSPEYVRGVAAALAEVHRQTSRSGKMIRQILDGMTINEIDLAECNALYSDLEELLPLFKA